MSPEGVPEHSRPGDSNTIRAEHLRGHLNQLPANVRRMGLSKSYFERTVFDTAFRISLLTGEEMSQVIGNALPAWRESGFVEIADLYETVVANKGEEGSME